MTEAKVVSSVSNMTLAKTQPVRAVSEMSMPTSVAVPMSETVEKPVAGEAVMA